MSTGDDETGDVRTGGPMDVGAVGLVGAGRMGAPMAALLARAGVGLSIWNRSGAYPQDCAGLGIPMADSLVELGRSRRVLLTMVPDLPEVQQVCDGPEGLLADAAPGTIVVVMGTVSQPRLRKWAATVTDRGFRVVDAPVSGGVEGAREGTLSIMVGGEAQDVTSLRPLFDVLGHTVRHLGPLGSGQVAKACNQAVVGATLAVLAEAVTLGRRSGLVTQGLLEVLGGGLAGSQALRDKAPRYLSGDYTPGAEAAYQHKDLGFVLEAARETGVATPVTALVDQLYGAMCSTGRERLDHSAVVEIVELLSGGEPRSSRADTA